MKRYLIIMALLLAVSSAAMAARVTQTTVTYPTGTVMQAYLVAPAIGQKVFLGLNGVDGGTIGAVPGILAFEPGSNWSNFIPAARDGFAYTVKNVVLQKVMGTIVECASVPDDPFYKIVISPQQGEVNIRKWWPVLYSVPGTTWTLTVEYYTVLPYDDDGGGPNLPSKVHKAIWSWKLDADFDSVLAAMILFHELPFGTCEIPLISDEVLFPQLLAAWKNIADLATPPDEDLIAAGLALFDFEMAVAERCILSCNPAKPVPTGAGTGITNTKENPACCKILADSEFIAKKFGLWGVAK